MRLFGTAPCTRRARCDTRSSSSKQLRRLSVDTPLPFLLRYKTDGRPDHNISFVSVVFSLIALPRAASFDAPIAHRPAPGTARSEARASTAWRL